MKILSIPLPEGDSDILLDRGFANKYVSTCIIKTPHKVVACAAVCNPNDMIDQIVGYKIAFDRAIHQLYPCVAVPEFDTIPDQEYNRLYGLSKSNQTTRAIAWKFFLEKLPEAVTA